VGEFTTGFMGVQAWINTTNQFINSTVNAQDYLGPTFTSMDNLTTNDITAINTNPLGFGTDLANQGNLYSLKNLNLYGTPAGLLFQLSIQGNMINGTLPAVRDAMYLQGLTNKQIKDLCSNNVQSLFNPNGLTPNEFDTLQIPAYAAMKTITGADLEVVLGILEVSTPNVVTMADLLDSTIIFPNSYSTMQVPTADGMQPIYDSQGSISAGVPAAVDAVIPSASGCEQLGKIIPPAQAVGNKAIQVALQQIGGVSNIDLPKLSNIIKCNVRTPWVVTDTYLADSLVVAGPYVNYAVRRLVQLTPTSQTYRAQQDVPAGINIVDTNYWEPVTLCGISTMNGLPLIQAQTTAIDPSVATFFATSQATGSGPNGTITTCDVIGTAIDHSNISGQLAIATSAMANIATLDSSNVGNINSAYVAIAAAAVNGDVTANIAKASGNITNIYTNPNADVIANVAILNSAFSNIANVLNTEKGYQNKAGIDYFNLQSGTNSTTMAFIQNISQYAKDCDQCGPYQFLTEVANTSTLGGQAVIGALREATNQIQLNSNGINIDIKPSAEPAITPPCAVNPVY
jgi:hypothetical protein